MAGVAGFAAGVAAGAGLLSVEVAAAGVAAAGVAVAAPSPLSAQRVLKVLVADDNQLNAAMTRAVLE